jgi:predicted nucleic acid-binding protein
MAAKAAMHALLGKNAIKKTPDLIIGTFCVAHGHRLLHNNRDFDPMAKHLGLLLA